MVILSALDKGTGIAGPTAQPQPWPEPQGSSVDFTHLCLSTVTTTQPCQPCVGH